MNTRPGPPALVAAIFLLAGAAFTGCQRPSVEEAVATATGSHSDHTAHLAVAESGGSTLGEALPAATRERSAEAAADLARIRAGTALYQQFDRAVAAGFVDPSGVRECVAHPEFGGMGVHFVNFERYEILEIDPAHPEILLYEPQEDGSMRLVGVEFAVNAEAWLAAGNAGPPSLAGTAYDPPNPAAGNPLVQTSWTLHVWTWQSNPNGMFLPFNPRVRCPVE